VVEFTLLLIGPPGVAKSMLTREAAEVISNSRYVKARNASGKGITAGKAGAALSSGGDGEVATTIPSVSRAAHAIDKVAQGRREKPRQVGRLQIGGSCRLYPRTHTASAMCRTKTGLWRETGDRRKQRWWR
jgi:DNA replicative helicase MCM subunit Mcm2 (Cdc46/Mcm family)